MKVAMLGAGVFGTAIGGIVAANGFDVDYYDPIKESERLADVINSAEAVVLCVPSSVASHLLPHIPSDRLLIVATKGFISTRPFERFKHWEVISGPGFADDIKAGKKVHFTLTSREITKYFKSPRVNFDYTDDKLGILLCGALKNVYAMIMGVLGESPRSQSWQNLIDAFESEIKSLLYANLARPETFDLYCGLEDLKLTAGPGSRNYEFGLNYLKNHCFATTQTVEGVETIHRIKRGDFIIPDDARLLKSFLVGAAEWI
ncbi:hypothetical protein IJG28_03440 [Candidatus Saccharibacteria bacterium]|nr:hypothetical protein [Candidatus Saccharibacteria bacterium]